MLEVLHYTMTMAGFLLPQSLCPLHTLQGGSCTSAGAIPGTGCEDNGFKAALGRRTCVYGHEAQHDLIMCSEIQMFFESTTIRSTLTWSEAVWAGVKAMGMKNERGNGEEGKTWEVRCNVKKMSARFVKTFLKQNMEISRKLKLFQPGPPREKQDLNMKIFPSVS